MVVRNIDIPSEEPLVITTDRQSRLLVVGMIATTLIAISIVFFRLLGSNDKPASNNPSKDTFPNNPPQKPYSGGGSPQLPLPEKGQSLEEKREVKNKSLEEKWKLITGEDITSSLTKSSTIQECNDSLQREMKYFKEQHHNEDQSLKEKYTQELTKKDHEISSLKKKISDLEQSPPNNTYLSVMRKFLFNEVERAQKYKMKTYKLMKKLSKYEPVPFWNEHHQGPNGAE